MPAGPSSPLLRRLALLLVLAASVFAGTQVLRVTFDPSIEVYFVEDDPALVKYHEFIETFDSDQIVVLSWRDPQLWSDAGLGFVHRVGAQAEAHPHVQFVRSITTMRDVVAAPGTLTTRPYYDAEDPPVAASLKEWILANDMVRGSLVSDDGLTTAVVLAVDHLLQDPVARMGMVRDLRALAERLGQERGVRIRIAGPAVLDEAFIRHTRDDLLLTFPLMGLMIVLSILGLFGTWRALPLPLAVIGLACLWVAGLMGLIGYRVTIIHTIVFPMVMGVGIASSLHVLARTILLRRGGVPRGDAVLRALRELWVPCFFTTATTVAGMSSLLLTTLRPLRQVGVLAAVGVSSALLITYALAPYLLPLMPEPASEDSGVGRWWGTWDQAMERLALLAEQRAGRVLAGAVGLMLLAMVGLGWMKVGSNPIVYFLEDDPVREDVEAVDATLAGAATVDVLIDTGVEDGLKEPEMLRRVETAQARIDGLTGVGASISVVDYLKELRMAFRGGVEEARQLPSTRAEVAQLLLMTEDPDELERLVDPTFRKARINATIKLSDGDLLQRRVKDVEGFLADLFPPPASAAVTGQSKLIANMDRYLLRSTQRSMAGSLVLVLAFMTIAFRSIRLGLFSMIPNVMPILMILGLMGWVGIRLDPGTTMIAAVALGLVVDDTVHFLHHFRQRVEQGDGIAEATRRTLHDTGRAIVMTSVILTASFWLMCLSSFYPNIYFGLLCGTTILLALVADLVVLPAALAFFQPRLGARSA